MVEQLKIDTADWRFDVRGIALEDDDDLFAVYMTGTLVLMRRIILYKYQEEASLSPEREAKLRCVVASYLEAELLIGEAVGKRRGYLTTAHKCRDPECYRRWFKTGISNVASASYRGRILPRLFQHDARAAELDRLVQSHAVGAPYMPSPAVTLMMEPVLKGVARAGCFVYGGDANGNGLCDDWENPQADTGAFACGIALEKVRMAADDGLRVTLVKGSAAPGSTVSLRVLRAESPVIDAQAKEVWPLGSSGDVVVQPGQDPDANPYVIVARGVDLTPDPSSPYLLIQPTSDPSVRPVHCEQPLPIWLPRQRKPTPSGLHGPYRSADAAVLVTRSLALERTAANEAAFLVLHKTRGEQDLYYTTPPVTARAPEGVGRPLVTQGDYVRSVGNAFSQSCETADSFTVASWAHTHPEVWWGLDYGGNNFSMIDFNFAIGIRSEPGFRFGSDLQIPSAPQKIYREGQTPAALIYVLVANRWDRCIRGFVPRDGDKVFGEDELGPTVDGSESWIEGSWEDLVRLEKEREAFFTEHYKGFLARQREFGCAPLP
ncbi:MAG: hypothetical protein KIS79_02455 [Burkholderiales bacterium]|nr:hypothetical protein [Burkholderiales bacterium]